VLGPLSSEDEASIRAILTEVDGGLELARHFGRNRAGWEGTGLELTWMPSGQLDISSFVEAGISGSECVAFSIELRPSWYFNARSSLLTWRLPAKEV